MEQEEITKTLLQRIFPEIKVSEKTHEQWLKAFEHKVCAVLNELKQKSTILENSDLEKQNKNLQGLVSHYKQVIRETVSYLLHFLQFRCKKIIYLKFHLSLCRKVCLTNYKVMWSARKRGGSFNFDKKRTK